MGTTAQETVMTSEKAHDLFGHGDKAKDPKIAAMLGIKLLPSSNKPCEACTIGKAKQKNVPKIAKDIDDGKEGEQIYLDIATVK